MRVKKKLICTIITLIIILFNMITSVYATDTEQVDIDINIGSSAGILIESKTGRILYEKDAYTKYYPASTTKVMTALLTLENVSDLKQVATVSYNAVYTVPSGYSIDLIKVGEELTIEDLLYAMLVKSSNEAANVLAEYISGNVESFATMMNTRAVELGCINTHFVNPNGVHNDEQYSTAYDLSLIAKEAMKNETFRKLVSTASYTLPSTNKYDRIDRNLITTNELIKKSSRYYYEYAIGIKTGYTTPAKNCLIAAANKDGVELILVLLHANKTNSSGLSVRDTDAKNLFEYVYNNFSEKTVIGKNSAAHTIKVKGATKSTKNLTLLAENQIQALVTNDKLKTTETPQIVLNEKIKAPIKEGDVLGTATYKIDGIEYKTNLIAANDVKKSYTLLIIFIIIVIFLLYSDSNKRKNAKKRTKLRRKKSTSYSANNKYYRY